jgi:hypothetical protein
LKTRFSSKRAEPRTHGNPKDRRGVNYLNHTVSLIIFYLRCSMGYLEEDTLEEEAEEEHESSEEPDDDDW